MKKIFLLSTILFFATYNLSAQFYGKNNTKVSECNCKKKLDELNVKVTVPEKVLNYDIVYLVIKIGNDDNAKWLGLKVYNKGSLLQGEVLTLNILNPEQDARRVDFTGAEVGLFGGKDFATDYAKICETLQGEIQNLTVSFYGINQVGLEVKYTYDPASQTTTGKFNKLYSSAEKIQDMCTVKVQQLGI